MQFAVDVDSARTERGLGAAAAGGTAAGGGGGAGAGALLPAGRSGPPPRGGSSSPGGGGTEACAVSCAHVHHKPVCGTDGRTYAHKCELKRARRCDGRRVQMARQGPCNSEYST